MEDRLLLAARSARDRWVETQRAVESARVDYHHAIRRLHAAGGSMREIARELGVSHQRVHQIVEEGHGLAAAGKRPGLLGRLSGSGRDECVSPSGAGQMFDRMGVDARQAMVLAQDEARALRHGYVGTEHVLLGLLGTDLGLAARVLTRGGLDRRQARAAVERIVGRSGVQPVDGPLRFTPRLKKVLELARKEAKRDHSPHVRGEHVLLGLTREGYGVGAAVLAEVGVGYDELRGRLGRAALACWFCRRGGLDVDHLVAGPGVFICDRCVTEAGQLDSRSGPQPQTRMTVVAAGEPAAVCSFCRKASGDVDQLVAAQDAAICGDCLALCREIRAEEQGTPAR